MKGGHYEFKAECKAGYLHVKATGRSTPGVMAGYLADTVDACRSNNCSRVLIEAYLEGPSLEMLDIFKLVSERSKDAWPLIKHVAYVDMNQGHDVERRRFAETVAVNRGVDMHLFRDLSAAEIWLTGLPAD